MKEEKEELSPTSPAEEQLPTKQPPMAHAVSLTPTPSGLTFSDSESEVAAVSGCDQDSTADEEGPLPGDVEDWGDPQRAPILQPSEGGRRPAPARAGMGIREVQEPFLERDDVGKYAVYQGNWGGHKKIVAVNESIRYDLVVNCKCQVVCAQEVDMQLIDKMHDPHSAPAKAGKIKIWAPLGRQEEWAKATPWHVTHGDEDPNCGTLLIAVRSTVSTHVERLWWSKKLDGRYKRKARKGQPKKTCDAYSRIMASKVHWIRPLPGNRATTNVVTCHWHHCAAKMQQGADWKEAHARFLRDLVWAIRSFQPEVLTGDFNMGLLTVAAEMRRQALNVEIVCWFAWHGIREGGAIAEEPTADGGGAQQEVEKKLDSCASFYCQPCRSVKPTITLSRFDSDDFLSTYARGQGVKLDSYLGGRKALEETLRQEQLASRMWRQ